VDRVLAIVELRAKLLLRRAHGTSGAFGLVIRVVALLISAIIALGMAAGLAALVHYSLRSSDEHHILVAYLVTFYTCFFFGLILPMVTGTMNPGLDVSPLKVFPIHRFRLFAIQLVAGFGGSEHAFYYPALLAVLFVGVLAHGLNVAASLSIISLLLCFYVFWGNTLTLFLSGVMRTRKIKEIVGIVVLVGIVAVSFLPVVLDPDVGVVDREAMPSLMTALDKTLGVGRALPPSLAAAGLAALRRGDTAAALGSMAGLALWNALGLVLGYAVFARYHLADVEPRRRNNARKTARRKTAVGNRHLSFDHAVLAVLPVPVRAVAAKDLHYLFRSVLGKFILVMLPVFVIIVAVAFSEVIEQPFMGMLPDKVLLLGMLLYTTLFSNNLANNAFAWEGDGAKAYFTSPVPLRQIIGGKNLAVWIYNVLLLVIALTVWFIFMGLPDPLTLLSALLIYTFAVLALTTCGNVVSVFFPVRRNMSAITNSPSQVAVLLSILTMVLIAATVTVFLFIPVALGAEPFQPVSLGVLLLLQIAIYRGVLDLAARALERRKELLLESLKSEH
jgi:hypothetical protein